MVILAKEVAGFLDSLLGTGVVKDPFCKNGIQVGLLDSEVTKIGFIVDSCIEAFEKAKNLGCDFLISHHGLWRFGKESITNYNYNRVKFLMDNNMSLYVSHLPLDLHTELGNNAQLVKLISGSNVVEFDYGVICDVDSNLLDIKSTFDSALNYESELLKFGSDSIRKVLLCSGNGASVFVNYLEDYAQNEKIDLFVTGERSSNIYHLAKETNTNVLFLTHYASETVGLKAILPELKKKFKIDAEFIEVQTGY